MDGPGLGPTTPHYALYIDLFIKPKSMKIPFFQSIRLFYFYLVVASVEEKSIHVYAQSKKH